MRIRHARVGSRMKGLMSTVGVRLQESKIKAKDCAKAKKYSKI